MFLNEKLHILYFNDDADLVEWEPNVFTFISDSYITITRHFERLGIEISLCDCSKLNNNCFAPVFLNGAVILIYCLR